MLILPSRIPLDLLLNVRDFDEAWLVRACMQGTGVFGLYITIELWQYTRPHEPAPFFRSDRSGIHAFSSLFLDEALTTAFLSCLNIPGNDPS